MSLQEDKAKIDGYVNGTIAEFDAEAFKRGNEVVEIRLEYKEEDRGTCRCGETVYLHDQYRAACQCPKCGRWNNLFGQELLPPEMWEEDY